MFTRRTFCATTAATLFARLQAQTARPDVAAIDHDRILAAANLALTAKPNPLSNIPAPHSPGTPHDFYSEATETPSPFTAHRDALFTLSRQVAALVAAFHLTQNKAFAAQAALHLNAWFVDPSTRMTPALPFAAMTPGDPKPRFEGILEAVFLAEIAIAIPFLKPYEALDIKPLTQWFASYLQWLTETRVALLARDQKDHHATSWLLQAAACARLTANEPALADLRRRFKTVTLRAQIVAEGSFPHELTTPWPYRNSLLNLDLLAASCLLLTSQFDNLWEYELQDGPGLRVVLARHVPYIEHRGAWPYRADLTHFTDLPVRNPALLFAARAYNRPEYAALWQTLNPDPTVPEIARTFPISQPLLWITKPRNSF